MKQADLQSSCHVSMSVKWGASLKRLNSIALSQKTLHSSPSGTNDLYHPWQSRHRFWEFQNECDQSDRVFGKTAAFIKEVIFGNHEPSLTPTYGCKGEDRTLETFRGAQAENQSLDNWGY